MKCYSSDFFQPFKNIETILSLHSTQKQAVALIRPQLTDPRPQAREFGGSCIYFSAAGLPRAPALTLGLHP